MVCYVRTFFLLLKLSARLRREAKQKGMVTTGGF